MNPFLNEDGVALELNPLAILLDRARSCYVINARGGHLYLQFEHTQQLIAEGLLVEVRRNEEAILYGLAPEIKAIDLKLVIDRYQLSRLLGQKLAAMIDYQVAGFEKLDVLIDSKQLPKAITVQWSLIGIQPVTAKLDFPEPAIAAPPPQDTLPE